MLIIGESYCQAYLGSIALFDHASHASLLGLISRMIVNMFDLLWHPDFQKLHYHQTRSCWTIEMVHKNKFIIEVGKTQESLIFCHFYGPLHNKFQIIFHTPKSCTC